MKVHLECEDLDCSVCRETAAVVEARLVSLNFDLYFLFSPILPFFTFSLIHKNVVYIV